MEFVSSITTQNSSLLFTNITHHQPSTLDWSVVPIFSIVTFILGFITNGTSLVVFVKDHTLRTPFNIYLINLLIANLAIILVQYSLDIVTNLHPQKWLLGNVGCTVYLYAIVVFQAVIINSHQLIAINRIWAATHPMSYRSAHMTIRTSCILCLMTWVYVHAVMCPMWLSEAMYYRLPVDTYGCQFNPTGWPMYNTVTQFLVYNLPILVMILAFPVIWFTRMANRRSVHRGNMVDAHGIHVSERARIGKGDNLTLSHNVGRPFAGPAVSPIAGNNGVQDCEVLPVRRARSHGYLLLALLIVSVSVCWIPINVYFALRHFDVTFQSAVFYEVAIILFSFQTALDPVLFVWALSSVRTSMRQLLCWS